MKIPSIDKRSKEDLINYIKEVVPYYSPQWRFDMEDLDMGSILALIFTDMFHGTIERLNKVPYKNFLTYLNTINAKLYSSISAKGYITFKLVDGIDEGILVHKGEKLSAQTEDSERMVFETLKNIYVTSAEVKYLFNTSYRRDTIIKDYDAEESKDKQIVLFNSTGENLQKHEFTINHPQVLNISGEGIINIYLEVDKNDDKDQILSLLSDLNTVSWTYLSKDKYMPLNNVIKAENSIEIVKNFKNENNDIIDQKSSNIGIIRCEIKDIQKFENLKLNKILLTSKAENLEPDVIYSDNIQQENKQIFAFGDRFSVYNDLHIACNEAFCKKGSDITISFELEFTKVPIEVNIPEQAVEWKLIMKKSMFKEELEYEISINEVMWEYWNGKGWAKLYLDKDYSKIFSFDNDYQKKKISLGFNCPEDIEETIVDSQKGYFIRARILRVNNAYKIRGWYISPLIDNIMIAYKYNIPVLPQKIETTNNMVNLTYDKKHVNDDSINLTIVKRLELENNCVYLAFDKKPEGSPIKILFLLESILPEGMPILVWEYYSENGWNVLSLVDETDNMRKSGIISFLGEEDFKKLTLFNKEMYWIRIYNLSRAYESDNYILPIIKGIFVNTTPIIQNDTQEEESFYINEYEKNKTCQLIRKNVNNIEVWVNEQRKISPEEIDMIEAKDLRIIKTSIGENSEIWVRWTEVNDFIMSSENHRHYVVDRNEGIIYFGDDVNGKIPVSQNNESIKVSYSVGGGEKGNIKEGQITSMTRSLGYINKIFNPIDTCGGCDMETIGETIERTPSILQHRGRAVTASDYENLVMEASRNITKVKCFSGMNVNGEKEPGAITLVILPKGNLGDDLYFSGIKEEVGAYLRSSNMSVLNKRRKFNIIPPYFTEISVKIEVDTFDIDNAFSVKQEIEDSIIKFIDPIKGNFNGQGWEIGEFPVRTQILNSLKNIGRIKKVKSIILSATIDYDGVKEEVDLDTFKKRIYSMPVNGKHSIRVFVK